MLFPLFFLFFPEVGSAVLPFDAGDSDGANPAFHHQPSQKGLIHKGAFQHLQEQLQANVPRFFPIGLMQISFPAIEDTAQISGTVYGTADALQRAGADEACRLPDEKDAILPTAKISEGGGAQYQTSLCFQGLAETKADLLQLLFLPLQSLSGVIQRISTAKYKLLILRYGPRTAICILGVKNTGIKGRRVGFGEPLLYGQIGADFFVRIKGSSDNGIGAVCPYQIFCRNGTAFSFLHIGDGKATVLSLQGGTNTAVLHLHPPGNEGAEPQVEFMAVQIDIKPLIMANEPIFQINGFHGKNLRIHQNILRQSQIKAGKSLLGIGGNQAAAGLLKAVLLIAFLFFIYGNDTVFGGKQAGQRGAGRSQTDDGNIIFEHRRYRTETFSPFLLFSKL